MDPLLHLIITQVSKYLFYWLHFQPIPAAERLALTIRYLASADSQQSMSFSYRMGKATVSNIIQETGQGIWDALNADYLRPATLTDEWKNIANEYMELWNVPHCLGAIDGKHIAIQCPGNSGSLFHKYKGFFSIVLMAVCDAHYVFSLVNRSNNDSGVLQNPAMGRALEHKHPWN